MRRKWKGLFLVVPMLLAFSLPAWAADNVTTESVRNLAQQTATIAVQSTVKSITARSNAVPGGGGGFFSPGSTGRSSGNGDQGMDLWVLGNGYYLDKSGSNSYTGDTYMLTGGFDKRFDDLVLGISLGGEWTDLRLDGGKYKVKGFTVAPYGSYQIMDNAILDFTVGYSSVKNDLSVRDGVETYDDDFNSWRLFAATGVTGLWEMDAWRFSARLGALYLHQSNDGFDLRGRTDTSDILACDGRAKFDLFQMQLGGRVGYDFGNVMPFFGVTYYQDIAKTGGNSDMVGADFDLGLNIKNGPAAVGITGTYGIREQFQKVGGMLNFRYEF